VGKEIPTTTLQAMQEQRFSLHFKIGLQFVTYQSVFHRILDFTRGWISIRPFLFLSTEDYRTVATQKM
jgi:hypothetical protein